ncbi:MAG: cysteine hydrolase family protein [Rhodoluna sp.]|nr:cysteine hydrolase family protein [Rhodoluna sp.]
MSTFTDRNNSALLVIDVQVGVMAEAFERESKIANMAKAIDKARAEGAPVIWVQHSDEELVLESAEWEIVSELSPIASEPKVRKTFRSSFVETNLEDVLSSLGVSHIFVCGAETNNCVRHTSHTALEMGYDLTLISDAHTTTGFEWNGYIVDAARVIDEQNTNFMGYSLPGRTAQSVSVTELSF